MPSQYSFLPDECFIVLLKYIANPQSNIWCVRIKPSYIQLISQKPTSTSNSYIFKITDSQKYIKIQRLDKSFSRYIVSIQQWKQLIENINNHEHTIVFDNIDNRDTETVINPYFIDDFISVIKSNHKKLYWKSLEIGDLKLYWLKNIIQDTFKDNYILYYCEYNAKQYAFFSNNDQMYWATIDTEIVISTNVDGMPIETLTLKFEDLPCQFKRIKYNYLDTTKLRYQQIPYSELCQIIDMTWRNKLKWTGSVYKNYIIWSAQLSRAINYTILSYEGHIILSIYNFPASKNEIYSLKAGDFHILLDFITHSNFSNYTVNELHYEPKRFDYSDFKRSSFLSEIAIYKWHISVNVDAVHFVCDDDVYFYGDLEIHYIYQADKAVILFNRSFNTYIITTNKSFIRKFTKELLERTNTKMVVRLYSNLAKSCNINTDTSIYDYSEDFLTDKLNSFIHNTIDSNEKEIVRYADLIVKCNVFRCRIASHPLMNIVTKIPIKDTTGSVKLVEVPAGYCKTCDTYFIHVDTYNYLKSMGRIMCRVIDQHQYETWNENNKLNSMQSNSILKEYGYTVSKQSSLNSTDRQAILAEMVDNGIITKYEIISYLNFFISLRNRDPSMEDAVDCWKQDIDFISHYNNQSNPSVTPKRIIRN